MTTRSAFQFLPNLWILDPLFIQRSLKCPIITSIHSIKLYPTTHPWLHDRHSICSSSREHNNCLDEPQPSTVQCQIDVTSRTHATSSHKHNPNSTKYKNQSCGHVLHQLQELPILLRRDKSHPEWNALKQPLSILHFPPSKQKQQSGYHSSHCRSNREPNQRHE